MREILSHNYIPTFATRHVVRWYLPLVFAGLLSYALDLPPFIRVSLVLVSGVIGTVGFCIASGVYVAARYRFGDKPRYSYLDPRND